MALYNNVPTFSYIHATGISVIWNDKLYMVQDFSTNLKYVYWNADLPNQLNASNVMPNRSSKQHLVLINDNGIATEVPPTTEDFSINYDGNNVQAIKDRIYGIYQKNEQFGEKFIAIETDIDGIKQFVGDTGENTDGSLVDRISKIEQKTDEINLSVQETTKKYNDDKEVNQLREDLNASIIKINSSIGTFKSELTGYFKNNEISDEEKIKIETQLIILQNEKASVDGNVDKVILIAEKNNQTQDVVALNSAKQALQNAHDNLKNNITNAIIDRIITPTENTIITDAFAKYNLRLNELKQTCDDIILLGLGGVLIEELANISIKSDEIKLSVSKVESDFKSEMSVQKTELEKQVKDVSNALDTFENTVNTVFKDGIIDEAEKSLLAEKITNIDKEKLDIDMRYNSIYSDTYLSTSMKNELSLKYSQYNEKHNELKSKIEYVTSDNMVNDAEKIEINTLFKEYSNALAYFSATLNKAIEDISFNTSQAELNQVKSELQGEINDVKGSIENLGDVIDGTFKDNILDEVEKQNIQQNLDNLTREKIDIDNTYNSMYASEYLYGQSKDNLKLAYDKYVNAFNEVVNISTGILNKETLIDNVDRANLDSAILSHKDKLNLLSIETNKVMDIIALNKSNALKGDMQQEISDVNNRIDDVLGDIGGAIGDGIIDEAEAIIIKNSLDNIKKEKLDVDSKYSVIYENEYLNGVAKTNLIQAKSEFDIAIENLISTITVIIEDNKVTDDESIVLEESKQRYMEKSAILNTRFQEAIDYISKTQVDKAKEQFQKEISDLGGVLSELENTMNGAFQDGILTEAEKLSIKQHLLTLSSEKSDIDKQYATIFANEHLEGQPKTNLTTAYNNYISSYNSLVTVINNILEKEGLIDSTDRSKLNNAFKDHDSKLGLYTEKATNALDAIAKKKAEVESEKLDKKFADIIIDLEEGITSKVEHLNKQVNGDGGISERLKLAEEKITEEGITQIVKDTQFIKDMDGKITTNSENITKVDQKADEINFSVEKKVDGDSIISAINMSPETIKINASKINITGFVTFTDLSTAGKTTINGANIDTTNLRVRGELISGQINGVGGIKFADGAVISSYDSHIAGYKGIRISAPSIKLGDRVDIHSAIMYGDITGKNNTSSGTTTWTMSNAGALTCASANLSGTLNVRNGVIYGMNNLALARGSIYIPCFGSSYTYDFIRGGNSSIAFADNGAIHFIYNGNKSAFIAGGTVYLPHAGNINCDHFRLGAGIMASPSSGSFHFLTANGNTSPLYAGTLYSADVLALNEPMVISNNSVFDKINSIDVIETKNGLRLYNPISTIKAIDKSTEVIKTEYDEDKNELKTSIDYTSAIAILWKAIQELKQENEELKKLIKNNNVEGEL